MARKSKPKKKRKPALGTPAFLSKVILKQGGATS
jgi:hypothetical protein